MASFCDNFRPNFWRPSTCANCYRPKGTHAAPRAPSAMQSPETEGRQVGVVKPYAVVDIPEEWRRRYSEPNVKGGRVRHASVGDHDVKLDAHQVATEPSHRRSRSASVAVLNGSRTRQLITPKRKAPPPPPRSQPSRRCTQAAEMGTVRGRATTVTGGDGAGHGVVRRKRVPPRKPPRTLSTFISAADQEALLQQLLLPQQGGGDCDSRQQGGLFSPTHERAESMPLGSCVYMSAGQLHSEILTVLEGTLRSVYGRSVGRLVCQEGLWRLRWRDLQVVSSTCVCYSGVPLSIECVQGEVMEEGVKCEMEFSRRVLPHPHLSLVRAVLDPPPSSPSLPPSFRYLLRDCTDGGLLGELLPPKRKTLSPEAYVELVLLCLVQVFSALQYLYNNGVCHRDVGLDCLYVTHYGSDWLVRLGNFRYSLHHPGPVTATTFVYGYHELKWLGGADSRLPPEVMDTPQNAQAIDYSNTDCFAAGCLIYEMMGIENPFEYDPELVYRQYSEGDLPSLLTTTALTPHLQRLAGLLLSRDPCCRLGAPTALLTSQALLWFPINWLTDPISDTVVQSHFSYEKALLVATLAGRDSGPPPLPLLLKANFLLNCNVSELLRTLSLFSH